MKIETVILPTDFSPCANNALRFAIEICNLFQAKLLLVHVIAPFVSGGINESKAAEFYQERQNEAKINLQFFKNESLNKHQGLSIETILLEGDDGIKEILKLCNDRNIDLVIAGTQGVSGIKEVILGTFSAKLMERLHTPILIIPEKAVYNGFPKLVYATELEENEIDRITEVSVLAKLYNGEVTVLNISTENRLTEDKLFEFEKKTREACQYEKLDFVYLSGGQVNTHIEEYSDRNNISLLIMTRKHKSIFDKIVKGTHTKKMAFQSKIPMLAFSSS